MENTISKTMFLLLVFTSLLVCSIDYVPNRILVKLTNQAKNDPNFQLQRNPLVTGLPDLDALNTTYGADLMLPVFRGAMNMAEKESLGMMNWYFIDLAVNVDSTIMANYKNDPNVAGIGLDYYVDLATPPNDPYYNENWGHHNTGQIPSWDGNNYAGNPVGTPGFDTDIETAWDILGNIDENIRYGSSDVLIAIIDSGIDLDHPDLQDNIWTRPVNVPPYELNQDWQDYYGISSFDDHHGADLHGDGSEHPIPDGSPDVTYSDHGVKSAGIACGITNNGIGISGVAGGSKMLIIKKQWYPSQNHSSFITSTAFGMEYAVDRGADIISMSWGYGAINLPGGSNELIDTDAMENFLGAIEYAAVNHDVLLLAATHNHDINEIYWPASNPDVIAVGAASPCGTRKNGVEDGATVSCDNDDRWGSNWSDISVHPDQRVDFLAPTILPTTANGGNYISFYNGTSCSTPYAAGVAALILSANPNLTGEQVRSIMWASATDITEEALTQVVGGTWENWLMTGWDMFTGYGMVNAGAAVQMTVDNPNAEFVRLFNKNIQGEDIGGTLKLEDVLGGTETTVPSGALVPVRFGDPYNVETLLLNHPLFTHLRWNNDRSEFRLRKENFVPLSGNEIITAYFDAQVPLDISANYGGISIQIRDPWYINQYGAQTDSYYPVENNLAPDGYYHVFPDQGNSFPNPLPPYYSLNAPEVVVNSSTQAYVFDHWTGNYCDIGSQANHETAIIAHDPNNLSSAIANYTIVIDDPAGASSPPQNLSIDVSSGNPVLNWDPVNDGDRSHYNVYANYMAFDHSQSTGWFLASTSKNNTWTDTNVATGGVSYDKVHYKVTVEDYFSNESGFSNTVQCSGDVIYYPARETDLSEATPQTFSLHAAYPNPFNPVTTIRYDLPVDSHVKLAVYDIRGGEVATLIDGTVPVGYHTIRWDAADFRSGIYFIRLITPAYTKTGKVILLK